MQIIEDDITRNWGGSIANPLVSICCIAFNHATYIEKCINGFLIQKTNFPFEILIHDDASLDGTQEIIQNYKNKFPNIINVVLQTENQYSRGVKPLSILFKLSKGNYIALCEGDDYWTDPLKIKKQYDFLNSNKRYSICYHNSILVDELGNTLNDKNLLYNSKRDLSSFELTRAKGTIATQTSFFRRIPELPYQYKFVTNEDRFLFSILGKHGEAKYLDDITASGYRIHSGGVWSNQSNEKKIIVQVNTYLWISSYFEQVGNKDIGDYYKLKSVYNILRDNFKNHRFYFNIIRILFQNLFKN
jgi:glycosyltransferase involved in cell wall biosynthesis